MTQDKPDNNQQADSDRNTTEFSEFLLGTADNHVHQRCEKLLTEPDAVVPETVVGFSDTVGDDSLLSALRINQADSIDATSLHELVGKLESLVPRNTISAEKIARALEETANPEMLGRVGRYDVVEFLASGGMGLVFRAIDPDLKREVCVKVLNPDHEFNAEAKTRFERESREMAKMNCERIVTVLDVGVQNGLPYLVMPMLAGCSLRTLLDREGQLEPERTVPMTRQIAQGLDYAHSRGVLHRDIKPDNLWVLPGGDIKILDFGLAHVDDTAHPITRSGTVLGTPSYMSPEQVTGKPIDRRSDLFSTGVVLVEMLTGKSPFEKANLFSTLMSVASEKIPLEELDPDSKIPQSLQSVVSRLLEKEPAERMSSAANLVEQLDAFEMGNVVPSQIGTQETSSFGNRVFKYVAAISAGFLACFACLALWLMNDKGTLVVSTSDPKVEVKISEEQVTIIDPLTEKRHVIRIGDTPLPSGVYQLESLDEESGLSFSSQTIAIKRGENSIVTVELVPATNKTPAAESGAALAKEANVKSDADFRARQSQQFRLESERKRLLSQYGANHPGVRKVEAQLNEVKAQIAKRQANKAGGVSNWADPTRNESAYSEEGQQQIAARVAALPGLNLAELGLSKTGSLSKHATVQLPINNAKNTTAWSIENTAVNDLMWKENADQTRVARLQHGWLQIRDKSHEKTIAMLPLPGVGPTIGWDALNPNLIAVSCFLETEDRKSPFEQKYVILVWHLGEAGAKLVRAYPAQHSSFLLERGYRMFCINEDGVKVHSLVDNVAWRVPDSAKETFYGGTVSPNGRYVTTYSILGEQTQISILDLKTGRLARAIHGHTRIQWSEDSTRIAALASNRNRSSPSSPLGTINIIDVVSGNNIRQMTPDQFSFSRQHMSLSPDFGVLANSFKGDVILMDLENGRKTKLEINQVASKSSRPLIRWLDNSRLEITSTGKTMIFQRDHGVVGKLIQVTEPTSNRESPVRKSLFSSPSVRHVSFLKNGTLGVVVGKKHPARDRQKDSTYYLLNVDDEKETSVHPVWGHYLNTGFLAGENIVSPSGSFAVQIGNSYRGDGSPALVSYAAEVWVQNLKAAKEKSSIGTFYSINQIVWSEDESYVVISGRIKTRRMTGHAARIIDLKEMKLVELNGISDESARDATAFGSGFLCTVSERVPAPETWRRHLFYFDPGESDAEKKVVNLSAIKELGSRVRGIGHSPNGEPFIELQSLEDEEKIEQYEISKDFKLKTLGKPVQGMEVQSWRLFNSQNEKPSLLRAVNIGVTVRHPKQPSLVCIAGDRETVFYDTEQKKLTGQYLYYTNKDSAPLACDDGWILSSDNAISVVDFEGRLLRRRFIYIDETTGLPKVTRWVHQDGSGATKLRKEHPDKNRFPISTFRKGIYSVE